MWPLELLRDAAWRPLTWTLLHFLWQGTLVALVCAVLSRLFQARRTQIHYLLALAGMFVMAACPVVTLVLLESDAGWHAAKPGMAPALASAAQNPREDATPPAASASPRNLTLVRWIGDAQPYVLGGWILGLTLLGGRLVFGVVGVRRLRRGRRALSGEMADRAAALARRMGLGKIPGVFVSAAAREAVVVGLLRPMVLLPVAWLAEMSPEVLEAVIAHELAHIRRFDLWFNLFQRLVETLLFYHPAVWWLSRRVRLAREMCCDELAARTTGDCVTYATALEVAARQRLAPAGSLLQVALGITHMTLLDRVRNVLGLGATERRGRSWLAVVLVLVVLAAAVGLTWVAVTYGKYTATARLRIAMEERPLLGGAERVTDRDRFEIYKNTQKELLLGRLVMLGALRKPEVAKLPAIQELQRIGDPMRWLQRHLSVAFPGNAEIMEVSITGSDPHEAMVLVNSVVDSYMINVVNAEREQKRQLLGKLDNAYAEKDQYIRTRRQELKNLALSYGTSDEPEMIAQKQRLLIDELSLYRTELAKRQFEAAKLEGDLVAQQALLKNVETADVPGEEADLLLNNDPVARQVSIELALKKQDQMYNKTATLGDDKSRNAERYQRELKVLQAQYDNRVKKLKEKVHEKKHSGIATEIVRLQTLLDITKKQISEMVQLVDKKSKAASEFGGSTVDIEMLRSEIRQSEVVLTELNDNREKARVELQAAPRITLLESAEVPPN